MSARDTILLALTRYYRTNTDPRGTAMQVLDGYDAARRADLLAERADVRDRMLRDAYTAGMQDADKTGRLRDYHAVWTTSDGSDVHATELRCVLCNALIQAVPPKTLLDLNAMATSHHCTPGGTA